MRVVFWRKRGAIRQKFTFCSIENQNHELCKGHRLTHKQVVQIVIAWKNQLWPLFCNKNTPWKAFLSADIYFTRIKTIIIECPAIREPLVAYVAYRKNCHNHNMTVKIITCYMSRLTCMRRIFPLDNLNFSSQFLQMMGEARNYLVGSKVVILRAQNEIWSPNFLEKKNTEGNVILCSYKFEKPKSEKAYKAYKLGGNLQPMSRGPANTHYVGIQIL